MAENEAARSSAQGQPPGQAQERSPEQIQQEIDATRAELGETVEAVAEKVDFKAQARQRADEAKEKASAKAEEVRVKLSEAAPESAGDGVSQVQELARENPDAVRIGGAFLAGLVVGRALWR